MPTMVIEHCREITNFDWNGKPTKVKNSAIINSIEDGGLNLQDLSSKNKFN
jgi:hypothetical protein